MFRERVKRNDILDLRGDLCTYAGYIGDNYLTCCSTLPMFVQHQLLHRTPSIFVDHKIFGLSCRQCSSEGFLRYLGQGHYLIYIFYSALSGCRLSDPRHICKYGFRRYINRVLDHDLC